MPPLVSVVIPTYNRKAYLQNAVESCFAGNKDSGIEVVVVDDGSSDGTRAWLESLDDPRVRTVFQENAGAPRARNRGLEAAAGTYVKFLDDDDWLAEGAIREETAALEKTGADVTYGQVVCVDETGDTWIDARPTPLRPVDDWLTAITREALSVHPARFTYRRQFLEDIRWKPDLPVRQDYDFALQVARKLPTFEVVDRVVYHYRQHRGDRVSKDLYTQEKLQTHLDILIRHVHALEENGLGTASRRRAAAAKLWIVGRMLAIYDVDPLQQVQSLIKQVAPEFSPPRSHALLSWVDSLWGPYTTERFLLPVRRMKASVHRGNSRAR
jgi:glycosyltransferase involved in cell wall biosynthesis